MTDIVERLVALANSLGGTEEDAIMAGVAKIERLTLIERNMLIENERLRGEVSLLKQALVDAKRFIFGHSGGVGEPEPKPEPEPTLRLVIDNALEGKP